jgi:hypothetical protein
MTVASIVTTFTQLFDRQYYLTNNPDVAAAGVDPLVHFVQFGLYEGRIPSAIFQAFENDYRADNSDVAAIIGQPGSDINSGLEHFIRFGYAETLGSPADQKRSATAETTINNFFNIDYYLATNPDVNAAVGRTGALSHFFQNGLLEGRLPSADAALFDKFYLGLNPDVAAAIQSGNTDISSGFEHFIRFGLNEPARRDVAVKAADTLFQLIGEGNFDASFYLTRNQDVAAAFGVTDPLNLTEAQQLGTLNHFVQYGLFEGRDPSVVFSNQAYLAANPDVAAAVGPNQSFRSGLEHFVENGFTEQRTGILISPEQEVSGQNTNETVQSAEFLGNVNLFGIAQDYGNNVVGATINAELAGTSTDTDFYKFVVTTAMNVTLTTIVPDGSAVDTELALFDSNGQTLASNGFYSGGGANGFLESQITQSLGAGTYFVSVSDFTGDNTFNPGAYSLNLVESAPVT